MRSSPSPSLSPLFSLVIITLNAKDQIEACITSVSNAAEIIVVDSGSTDGTQSLASSLGAKVIDQEWLGFGPQKQFAVEQATHDWVLCLDADEALSEQLKNDITLKLNSGQTCFRMARRNQFLGRGLRHGEGYPDWNIRLFHRSHAHWSDDKVHEHVICDDTVATLKGDLHHYSATKITDYMIKQNSYTSIQATILHDQGKTGSVIKLLLSPLIRFIKFYFVRRGFLDGIPGLVHISIGCFNSFIKVAKLMELEMTSKDNVND